MSHRSLFLVTLLARDYEEAKTYFCGLLGFECIEDTRLGDGKRWLVIRPTSAEGAALLIAKATTEEQRAAIGRQTGDRVGFFLATDDFERDHALMKGRGIEFVELPRRETYGIVAVFRDLYGNKWDLIQHRRPSAS